MIEDGRTLTDRFGFGEKKEGDRMENIVSITKTIGYDDIYSQIETSVNILGRLEIFGRVLIKLNLCDLRAPSSGAITHPLFLDALLGYLRKNYRDLDIVVIESDATVGRPDIILKWFGFDKILEKWDAEWYNLSKHPTIKRKIGGYYFDEMPQFPAKRRIRLLGFLCQTNDFAHLGVHSRTVNNRLSVACLDERSRENHVS